jgi:hypothetical protein
MTSSRDDRLPFTVLLPDSGNQPIEIHDHLTALRLCVVEKDSVGLLSEAWDAPGAYVLLSRIEPTGTFGVYVGKAPSGVRNRLLEHRRQRDFGRALLIQRSATVRLSSAQAGWLEGDLYDLFDAAERAYLHNQQKPGDDTVPGYDLRILESFRDPIVRVLRLIGYDPSAAATDEPSPGPSSRGGKSFHGVRLTDLLEAGLLAPGARLVSMNSSWPASATVLENGKISTNNWEYESLSAAAGGIKGGAVNGWDFWAVEDSDGSTRMSALRARYQDHGPVTGAPSAGASPKI